MSETRAATRVGLGPGEREADRLRRCLSPEFTITDADSPECALRLIGPREIVEHGAGALRRHRARFPEVPALVVLPGQVSGELVRDCYRHGAADVLSSAEIEAELRDAMVLALDQTQQGQRRESEAERLAAALGERGRDLEEALAAVRDAYDQTLGALVTALDYRERETGHHSHRVSLYSTYIGRRLGLPDETLENLYRGALTHDIGKIGTPDSVLLKEGPLDPEEWEVMRRHAEMGAAILSGIAFLRDAGDVPMAHHEAWDGRGYPRGLREHEIPLAARIFAVADSYDAIRSTRPYKQGETHETAVSRLREAAGRRLDPNIVAVFCHEPEATWTELDKFVGGSLTFQSAQRACHQVESQ